MGRIPARMQLPFAVSFVERRTRARVPGSIRIAVSGDMLGWTRWRYRSKDEDRAWDWWSLHLECSLSPERYECYAALAANDLQGLMVVDLKERSVGGGRGIAIDYLATNPANRTVAHGVKNVGISLIAVAVMRSFERRCAGRIWLESLAGAEGFYESLGMIKQARISKDGNAIYILDPEAAKQLLEEIRQKGIVAS